jgi:ribosome-associated toxin RatA of RatAB toxin-antitoxin module
MPDQARETVVVEAPPERCFAVATDFERYPEWARDVKEVAVLERDGEGRATKVAFRAGAMGRTTRYTLAYDYTNAPRELAWRLVEGDIMRRLDGAYTFAPAGSDGQATEVTYTLTVELVVPIPGFVKRRAEGKIIGTALDELKRRAEQA